MKKVFVCFSSFVPSTSYWTTYPKQIQSSKTKNPPQKKKGKSVYLQFNERLRRQGELFKKCDFLKEEEENLNEEVYGWIPLFKQDFLLYFEESSSSCMQKLHLCKLRDINLLALETIFIGILAPFMEKEQFKTFNRFNLLKESSNEGELIFDSIFFFREIVFQNGKESVEKCLFHLISPFFFALFFFLLTAIIKLFTNNKMHYHDLAKYRKKKVFKQFSIFMAS